MDAQLNSGFQARVNLMRLLAAGMAVIYHVRFLLFAGYPEVSEKSLPLTLFYFVTSLGHEAFVMYMVISGLALGGLSIHRWRHGVDPEADLLRRSTWFYCLLTPALLLGGALDFIGTRALARPEVYAHFTMFSPSLDLQAFAGNMLMLQRFVVPGLGSNTMLYLLAYECWAYLALAALFVLGKRSRALGWCGAIAVACAGSVLAPEFLGYLLLWIMGTGVGWLGRNTRVRVQRRYGLPVFVIGLLVSRWGGAHVEQVPDALIPAARMALDLLFGASFALLTVSWLTAGARQAPILWLRWTAWRLNRWFSGASFVLFTTHFPFMMFVVAVASAEFHVPIGGQPGAFAFALFGATVVAICLYAYAFSAVASRLARKVTRIMRARRLAKVASPI
nr:hypothetical protein [uncultured Duganella sp.]